jgi:hypothetical protein
MVDMRACADIVRQEGSWSSLGNEPTRRPSVRHLDAAPLDFLYSGRSAVMKVWLCG